MASDIIVKIGADISDFASKLKSATREMSSMGEKLSNIGKNLSLKVTAPIAALGTAAVVTGAKFDQSMSNVAAVTGATGNEFDKLREQALELGSATVFSSSQAAQGMEMLGRAGFTTSEIVETMPGMLDLAAAGALDLGDAADITSNILSGFGLAASEAGRLADVLALGSASANIDVLGMGEAFKYVGPVASQLGLSIEDAAAAIGILGDAGIQGGQAGNTLKRGLLNLSAPSKQASDLMKKLGIEVFDADGNMKDMAEIIKQLENGLAGMTAQQKTATLETLFGAEAVSGWSAMVGAGSDKMAEFTAALQESEGAAKRQAVIMKDNLTGSFAELMSVVELLSIQFYDVMKPAIKVITESLIDLVSWFTGLNDSTKQVIVVIGTIVAAIGPLLMILGTLMSTITKVMPIIKGLGTVIGALTSPIGLIVIAVAGLAFLIYKYWDEIAAFTTETWTAIKVFFSETWDAIKELFNEAVAQVVTFVKDSWERLKAITSAVWTGIKVFFSTIWNDIKGVFSDVITAVVSFVKERWNNIKTNTSTVFNTVKTSISTVWNNIKKFFSDTLTNIWTTVKEKFTDIVDSVREKMENVKTKVEEGWNNAKAFLEGIDLYQIGKDIIQGLINGIGAMAGAVWKAAENIASNVKDSIMSFLGVKSPARELIKIGKFTGEGFALGIESMQRKVAKASDLIAEAAIPKRPNITMAYDTPAGIRSSLSSAINGTVDISSNEGNRLLAEISSKLDRQKQMIVEMDSREVGRAVSPTVDRELGRRQANSARRAFT